MNVRLLPAWGLYRLQLRLNRVAWAENLAVGLALPLAFTAALGAPLPPASRLRMLLGAVLVAQAGLVLRRVCLGLAVARFGGRRRLLSTTAVGTGAIWSAQLLDAITLSVLPVVAAVAAPWTLSLPAAVGPAWLAPYAMSACIAFGIALVIAACATDLAVAGNTVDLFIALHVAFCPVVYPLERVPDAWRTVAMATPLAAAAEAMEGAWRGDAVDGPAFAVLLAWGVVAVGASLLAARRL